jgi:hypothetical protein
VLVITLRIQFSNVASLAIISNKTNLVSIGKNWTLIAKKKNTAQDYKGCENVMKFPCAGPPPNLKNLMNFSLKNRGFLTNEVFF